MNILTQIPQLMVYGLISGAILSLGGIGLSLTYSVLRFSNFSHGDLITVGAYFSLAFLALTGKLGIPNRGFLGLSFGGGMLVAMVLTMGATAGVAVLLDRLIYRRLRKAHPVLLLMTSVGVAFVLRNAVLFSAGPNAMYYSQRIQRAMVLWGIRVKPDHFFILAVALLCVVSVWLFLTRTKIGKAMRAMADNPDLAKVTGINTERVVMWTWVIGASLAAIAGTLAGIENKLILPELGWQMLLPLFSSVILGGIGNPYGAMVGGMIIGLSGEISTAFVSPAYKPAVAFVILVIILILRPKGLFGRY